MAAIAVIDADGRLRASGSAFPVEPGINAAGRDFFLAEKRSDGALPFVSAAHASRQSAEIVFTVAGRAPPTPDGEFGGVVSVSVGQAYFERFYRTVEPVIEHSIILVRADGEVLASEPRLPLTKLHPAAVLLASLRAAPDGSYDGVENEHSCSSRGLRQRRRVPAGGCGRNHAVDALQPGLIIDVSSFSNGHQCKSWRGDGHLPV